MLRRKAKRAAAVRAARDPREISTTGKRREFPAIIIRPTAQAFQLEPRFEFARQFRRARHPSTCGGAAVSTVIGIDPGGHGAVSGFDESGNLLWAVDIPSTREANGRIATNAPPLALMPASPSASMSAPARPTRRLPRSALAAPAASSRAFARAFHPNRVHHAAGLEAVGRYSARCGKQGSRPDSRDCEVADACRIIRAQMRRRPCRSLSHRLGRVAAGGAPWMTSRLPYGPAQLQRFGNVPCASASAPETGQSSARMARLSCQATGVSFYCYGGQPNSGTFQISLSSTSAKTNGHTISGTTDGTISDFDTGLNTSNLSTNVGSDNTVVYSGVLPALSNGMLTITFTTPFTYNPANGNLLLDVQPSTIVTNSYPFIYCYNSSVLTQPTPWTLESSMAWTNSNLGYPSYILGRGLITTFSY